MLLVFPYACVSSIVHRMCFMYMFNQEASDAHYRLRCLSAPATSWKPDEKKTWESTNTRMAVAQEPNMFQ